MNCIFCLIETGHEPVEHIFPEGLVGHQPFEVKYGSIIADPRTYLLLKNGEVCTRCNTILGRLDEYLQKQFGFLRTCWNPVGTKSGNHASAQRHGMHAERRKDGPYIALNIGGHQITTPSGVRIAPAGKHELAVRVKDFQIQGRMAKMTIQQPIRINKKFVRALHKIAFELLCFQEGSDLVLDSRYNPIRRYILRGIGNREMILTRSGSAGEWEQPQFGLHYEPSRPGWLASIRLASTFFIDLSPDNKFFTQTTPTELTANNLMKWSNQVTGSAGYEKP